MIKETNKLILDLRKMSDYQDKPILTDTLLKDNKIHLNARSVNKASEIIKPDPNRKLVEEKDLINHQNKVNTLFKTIEEENKSFMSKVMSTNKRDDIEMGLETTSVDFSDIEKEKTPIAINSVFPDKWDNVTKEHYPTSSIKSLIKMDDETRLKMNLNSFVLTELKEQEILNSVNKTIKVKDVKEPNSFQKFGTKNTNKLPVIVKWETIDQGNGYVIKSAVYG